MSVHNQAVKAGLWLAVFNGIAQLFSWASTFIVARLLVPADYGLMEMATILTGYVFIFHELGLGSAIIQRKTVEDSELSTLFWLTVIWGASLGVLCYFLAYPTVQIFNEPRLLPLTQFVSVLFLISPLNIVPRNLLHRQLKFKLFGSLMAVATVSSCVAMILFAWLGFGVWTLIYGHIIRESVQLLLFLTFGGWRPKLHFNLPESIPFLSFGLPLVFAESVRYLINKADVYFGGRQFSAGTLGYYSFGLRLAEMPKIKLLAIFNSVAFPAFAKLQSDPPAFRDFYLKTLKAITLVAAPVYLGGLYIAPDLIPLILGEEWRRAVIPFQIICVGKLVMTLTSMNQIVTTSLGHPKMTLWVHLIAFPLVVTAFWICSRLGQIEYLALPWLLVFPLVHLGYTLYTLRLIEMPVTRFIQQVAGPLLALGCMLTALWGFGESFSNAWENRVAALAAHVGIGAVVYGAYVVAFEKELIRFFVERYRNRKKRMGGG